MSKKHVQNKPKVEFSKKLVAWAMVLTSLCLIISYTLAFFDHDACSEITVSVTSACIAIAVAYEAKSYGEKNSRNKYGIEHYWKCETGQGDADEEDSNIVG